MAKNSPLLSPIDYTTKLSKIYDRQSQQLQIAHQQLRERDQQMVEKARAEDPVKMLAQFAQTVTSVKKAADTFKASGEKKANQNIFNLKRYYKPEEITDEKTGKKYTTTFRDDLQKYIEYNVKESKLNKEGNEYEALISRLTKHDPEAGRRLKSLHGKNLYHAKAHIVSTTTANAPELFIQDLNHGPNAAALQADYARLNPQQQGAFRREWLNDKLGSEVFNDKLLFKYGADNISRWEESANFRNTEAIRKSVLSQEVQSTATGLSISFENNDHTVPAQKVLDEVNRVKANLEGTDIQYTSTGATVNGEYIEGITAESTQDQIARSIVKGRLESLAYAGYLSTSELTHISTAGGISIPAGDSVENIFNKDEWADLQAAAQKGDLIRTRIASTERKARWQATSANAQEFYADPKNWNKEELQNIVNTLNSQGADRALVEPLERMLENSQSKDEYVKIMGEWEQRIEEGLTGSDVVSQIKAIPHAGVRDELLELHKQYKVARDSISYDTNIKSIINQRVETKGKVELGPRGAYPGEAEVVSSELKRVADKAFTQGVNNGLTGNELLTFVTNEVEREWASNGGNEPAKTDNPGKYTKSPYGKFEKHEEHRTKLLGLQSTAKAKATEDNIKSWNGDITRWKTENEGTDFDKIFDTPQAIITADDFAGMLENGYYSAELKYKAKLLGMSPGQLFERQLAALLASPDPTHQRIVAEYDLGEVDISPAEVELFKQLEATWAESKMVKRQGAENLTENQVERINLAQNLAKRQSADLEKGEPLPEEVLQDIETKKEELKKQLKKQDEQKKKEQSKAEKAAAVEQLKAGTHPILQEPYGNLSNIKVEGQERSQLQARIEEELDLPPEERSLPSKYYEPFE